MKDSHGEDTYNLTEEIAVRAVFRTIRPNYLADHFNTAFYELSGDVYAQARLVDIGLRYENNLALNLAAARKIRVLLDEHKILMIPAYIETSAPEIATIIATAIPTIRAPDPRRYFLERWMHHEHPAVARICREALAGTPPESVTMNAERQELKLVRPAEQAAEHPTERRAVRHAVRPNAQELVLPTAQPSVQPAMRTAAMADASAKTGHQRKEDPTRRAKYTSGPETRRHFPASPAAEEKFVSAKKNPSTKKAPETPRPKAAAHRKSRPARPRPVAPEKAYRAVSSTEADSFGYEKLISLIGRHIGDPRPEIRLKWVKLIGHIPERLDPDDEHKMRFISIGLSDPVQEICLEAIAQIEFLIHDRSKLSLLLKIIDSKSPLIRSKEARAVIETLAADSRKLIENRAQVPEKAKKAEANKNRGAARTGEGAISAKGSEDASTHKPSEPPDTSASGTKIQNEAPAAISQKLPTGDDRAETRQSAIETAKGDETSGPANMRTDNGKPDGALAYSADEKAELTEIVGELDLPAEALAELEKENTPSSLLIKEIAPVKPLPHVDNYFLRHSAVLHIKNIHAEELRFELYQTVLKHDPKDLVRQIAVEESRNLKREHVRPILRLGLEDPAWQVRSDVLEYLLPFLSGTDEEGQILRDCVKDSDYHIRQKADEKLLTMSRRSAAP